MLRLDRCGAGVRRASKRSCPSVLPKSLRLPDVGAMQARTEQPDRRCMGSRAVGKIRKSWLVISRKLRRPSNGRPSFESFRLFERRDTKQLAQSIIAFRTINGHAPD